MVWCECSTGGRYAVQSAVMAVLWHVLAADSAALVEGRYEQRVLGLGGVVGAAAVGPGAGCLVSYRRMRFLDFLGPFQASSSHRWCQHFKFGAE